MGAVKSTELPQKEKDALDRKLERLEPKIVDAKHKYDELIDKYAELYEKRHPEKKEERIKETLYHAYQKSDRSMEEILAFMSVVEEDEW